MEPVQAGTRTKLNTTHFGTPPRADRISKTLNLVRQPRQTLRQTKYNYISFDGVTYNIILFNSVNNVLGARVIDNKYNSSIGFHLLHPSQSAITLDFAILILTLLNGAMNGS